MDAPAPAALDRAAALIGGAQALLVAAGAGIGVDSGLPDFRGTDGFWRAYPALAAAQLRFEAIASPAAFEADLPLAWGFYGHRLALYRATVPHAGFAILRRWGERLPGGLAVYTSNVDGQFAKAGYAPAAAVHECHGSIHRLQCLVPCGDAIWDAAGFVPDVDAAACRLRNAAPRCPHCGGPARPNVLMFGDAGWIDRRERAQAMQLQAWLGRARGLVVVEIGAGSAVPTVRWFSERLVAGSRARLVRINPREPQVPTHADVGLAGGALAVLQELDRRLGGA